MLLKVVLGLLAVLVLAVIGIQIFLPDRVASDIEARLTEGGGTASAEVESLPAVRLIWADGDRIEVSGSDLVLDVENDVEVLDRLDGFDQVDVSLENVEAGPFQVSTFELRRQGGGAYTLRSDATTSGTELLEFGAESPRSARRADRRPARRERARRGERAVRGRARRAARLGRRPDRDHRGRRHGRRLRRRPAGRADHRGGRQPAR